ncbi:MAG: shikimate dehydrogenase [Algoriphagus sp.]|jgi:shikimate dehydrogenase|uniref:shikimate dehydrogenase family protein n=1 Tax=Algoriphagus sp. TaxID=1872435 RepID=UPI00260A7314|nr:shikimate dehydrogenase [Algoriphagus sp.]MDG1275927.1 shikimate dehydrogenase [Algoriphagus sp.]
MRKFGLIGFPLGHSFSKKYFQEKFEKEGITNCSFELFEIPEINQLQEIIENNPELEGLCVTIPYKEQVKAFMDELDPACAEIGAVNCIQIKSGKLHGNNTDYIGFKNSLEKWLGSERPNALVLGTGGASKAIKQALKVLGIKFLSVSRSTKPGVVTYQDLKENPSFLNEFQLIINTTPVGTFPKIEEIPDIPADQLTANHRVYDLVYNPSETKLMSVCLAKGGKAKNGYEMLVLQAEAAWEIWNTSPKK